jgi:tetratricopeptide (TPR) repeat protein
MGIMLENGKCKELVTAFKDEDIGTWPDYCIHHGFYRRGLAYLSTGDAQAAVKDLELAATNSVGTEDIMFQPKTFNGLGAAYLALKNDQKALDAYRKVSSFTRINRTWTYIDSVLASARILSRQGKNDAALSELKKLSHLKDGAYDRFMLLQTRGDIHEAQGKREEALRDYNEALGFKGMPKTCVDELNKKIKSLAVPPPRSAK